MDDERLSVWETLFHHALEIIDAASGTAQKPGPWSFGGGTALASEPFDAAVLRFLQQRS